MADQQIDKLSLKVEVKENDTAKTISSISSAIDKLTSSLKGLNQFSAVIDKLAKIKMPKGVSNAVKSSQSAVKGPAPKIGQENPFESIKPPAYALDEIRNFGEQVRESFQSINVPATELVTNLEELWEAIDSGDAVQQIEQTTTALQNQINAITGVDREFKSARDSAMVFAGAMKEADEEAERLAGIKAEFEAATAGFKKVSTETKRLADGTKQVVEKFELLTKAGKKTVTAVNGVVVSEREAANATKKHASSMSKLLKAFGRIAFYRMVRSAIKEIVQTWQEGLNNFVQYDEETNKAMSDVKNSWTQIKNTIGVTAGYLIQTLAPIITALADKVVQLLDNLNMALAKFQGKDKFAKAKKGVDDYAKSLQKANAQLLSFDTFTTLGGGGQEATSPEDMFEDASVAEEWNDTAETFASIINLVQTLWDSIQQIIEPLKPYFSKFIDLINSVVQSVANTLSDVLEQLVPVVVELLETLLPVIMDLIEFITPILLEITKTVLPTLIKFIASVVTIIARIIKILMPIVQKLIEALQPLVDTILDSIIDGLEMVADILEFVSPFLQAICEILKPIMEILKKVLGFFNNMGKGIFGGIKSIFGFAGGGTYERGDYFKANENGVTEMIASTNNGGSVMNIDQWASISYSSFFRALSDYGAARDDNGNVTISADTIGRALAGNRGFISEMNRRNGALNLR